MISLGKSHHTDSHLFTPATATDDYQWALRVVEKIHHHCRGIWRCSSLRDRNRRQVRNVCLFVENIFRENQHNRSGPPRHCGTPGTADIFRYPANVFNLCHPLCQRAEHGTKVNFLECFAIQKFPLHLPNHQYHGCRILMCDMSA